jgi:hypothetical protein
MPVGARNCSLVQTGAVAHPLPYSVGAGMLYCVFGSRGVKLHTYLAARLRMRGALLLIHLYAFMP